MKVLLVSSGSGSRGGGEIFLEYLGKGLIDRGHEVLVWLPSHPRMDELASKCAPFFRVVRGNYRNTYDYPARSLSTCFNWRVSNRIAHEWTALGPDVIHVNKQNLEDGLDLLRAARRCALPSICTIHLTQTSNYLRAKAAWLRDRIAQWQLDKYDGTFVAVQERRREQLQEFLSKGKRTITIFNGVSSIDADTLRPLRKKTRQQLGLLESDFLVLGVGRLVEQKQPFLFLKMAEELHARLPNMRALWVGDGKLGKQWRMAIANKKMEGIVSCTGWQTDVLPYLLAADLLLHVAEFEGLPFVVMEAMAAGLACAVTRELSSEIPFFNETNVFFIDDIEKLAEKMRNLRAVAEVGRAGRCLVENKLSVNRMVESYEQLYINAIKEKRR